MVKLLFLSIIFLLLASCQNLPQPSVGFWHLHEEEGLTSEEYTEIMLNFLYEDLNFLEEKLMAYSPLINVVARQTRVDIPARFEFARTSLKTGGVQATRIRPLLQRDPSENYTRLVAEEFFDFYLQRLFPSGIGHMFPLQPEIATNMIMHIHACDEELAVEFLEVLPCTPSVHDDIFRNPNVISFYDVDLSEVKNHEIRFLLDDRDDEPNVKTRVIVPESVAYVSINHFMSDPDTLELEIAQVLEFYEEISNYDHLIFDLRNNKGGFNLNLMALIFSPLISEPLEATVNQFVRESFATFAREEIEYVGEGLAIALTPASEFFQENHLNNIHTDDLAFLNYAVSITQIIEPANVNFPFSGQIWFLINNQTASISELAVLYGMSSNFATVVGENTMGIMPASRSFINLPNTGIVFQFDVGYFTDESGRSLEEFGITPHYHNRPRMDALGTVLALIEEMKTE